MEFNEETYKKLVEKEINDRYRSNIRELADVINIHFKASELANRMQAASLLSGNFRSAIKAEGYFEAVKSLKEIVDKELHMGSPHHNDIVKKAWLRKEHAVNTISHRILKRGTREYDHLKSFINDTIEKLLYTK